MKDQAGARVRREGKTLAKMVALYCRDHHANGRTLCGSCQGLLDYALDKLRRCPFQDDKPVCENCQVHCYEPGKREEVKEIMRYSGPRMLGRHPLLALRHMLDNRKTQREKKASLPLF